MRSSLPFLFLASLVLFLSSHHVSGGSLGMAASVNDLCPVVKFSSSVSEMSADEIRGQKLSALQQDQLNSMSATGSKAYKVILTPLSFARNSSMPSIDWIDLHFKVNEATQENVQMKAAGAMPSGTSSASSSSPSSMSSHASSMSASSSWQYGPIFLKSSDELVFAHTICAGMIDCITEEQHFRPADEQRKKEQEEQQNRKRAQPPPVPQQTQPQPQPNANQQQNAGCPAIQFTHKLACGDDRCKVSFVNLSPDKPLDWVDIHVRSNSASFGISNPNELFQQNFRMKLAMGESNHMMMSGLTLTPAQQAMMAQQAATEKAQLSSASDMQQFGADSSPAAVMAATGGKQVWQYGLPMLFHSGDRISVSFTYCQNGTDCDTETFEYTLKDDADMKKPTDQQQPQQPQQPAAPSSVAASALQQFGQPELTQQLQQAHPLLSSVGAPSGSLHPLEQPLSVSHQVLQSPWSSVTIESQTDQVMIPLATAIRLGLAPASSTMPMSMGSTNTFMQPTNIHQRQEQKLEL